MVVKYVSIPNQDPCVNRSSNHVVAESYTIRVAYYLDNQFRIVL
jgi:hypothetical protein